MKKIFIASDHAGYNLKNIIISKFSKIQKIIDLGPNSNISVDYPDYAKKLSKKVASIKGSFGILVCGSGMGMSIAANKIPGIRAANVTDVDTAIQSVEHNNANILCLGANNVSQDLSIEIINNFLASALIEEEKYIQRIHKIK